MLLQNGTVLQNRYRIDTLLRQEDMGAVYRATDIRTSSPVAVTEHHILSVRLPAAGDDQESADESLSSLSSSEEVRDRFEKEAQVLAELNHPGVPKLLDYFDIPGHGQYLVMEFVEGHDLEETLATENRPGRDRVIGIGLELCGILDHLHGRTPPVIHRDIKPSNVRITPDGRVILVGFGVGREQSPGEMTLGAPSISPGYSPLEQYGGDDITDHRSDVYSLGATLLALATGEAPLPATERALTRTQVTPPAKAATWGSDPSLLEVLARATALLPKDRYQNVRDLQTALDALLPHAAAAPAAIDRKAEPPEMSAATVAVVEPAPVRPVVVAAPAKPPVPPVVVAAPARPPVPPVVAAAPAKPPAPPVAVATAKPELAPAKPVPAVTAAVASRPATSPPAFRDESGRSRFQWIIYPVGVVGLILVIVALVNIVESDRRMAASNYALKDSAEARQAASDSSQEANPAAAGRTGSVTPGVDVQPGAASGTGTPAMADVAAPQVTPLAGNATPAVSPDVSAETAQNPAASTAPPSTTSDINPAKGTSRPDQRSASPGLSRQPSGEDVATVAPRTRAEATNSRESTHGPAPVRLLPVAGPGSTSVDLEWTPSEDANFSSYEIYYARQSDDLVVPLFIRWAKTMRNRNTTKASVPNLRCGTSYDFKVRSVSRSGAFRDSEPVRAVTAACAAPDTLVVSSRGEAPYVSIEDALRAAAGGSKNLKRILLRPGNYVLNGTLTVDRPVTITGIGPRANIVIEQTGDCLVVDARIVAFRGVTIRSGQGRAVVVKGEAIFDDCDISSRGICVDVQQQGAVTLRGCRVHDSRNVSVRLDNSAQGRIEDCVVSGSSSGVTVEKSGRLVLSRCQVLRMRDGNGVTVGKNSSATITACDISACRKSGVSLRGGAAEIRDCRINKNRWYAVDCSGDGAVRIERCSYAGNFPDNINPLCGKSSPLAAH